MASWGPRCWRSTRRQGARSPWPRPPVWSLSRTIPTASTSSKWTFRNHPPTRATGTSSWPTTSAIRRHPQLPPQATAAACHPLEEPSGRHLMKIFFHLALSLALAGCVTGAEVPRVATLSVGQWPEELVSTRIGPPLRRRRGSATVTVLNAMESELADPARESSSTSRGGFRAMHVYVPNEATASSLSSTRETEGSVSDSRRAKAARDRRGPLCAPGLCRQRGRRFSHSSRWSDGQVLFTVPVGHGPGGVAVDPVTSRVFIVSVKQDRVLVIDGARGLRIAAIPVGRGPRTSESTPRRGLSTF